MRAFGRASVGRASAARRWLSAVAVHRSPGVPTYPRDIAAFHNVQMHLGVGGFHRSHQAHYLHELLEMDAKPGWALCGVGLMPADAKMANALREQNYLYTMLSQGEGGSKAEVVGSIMDFLLVPEAPEVAVKRLADPAVKIVSLTITEKGYCLGVDFHLDVNNSLVAAELAGGGVKSALGLISAALISRRRAGVAPFTVMSCDNMPDNGALTRRTLLEFLQAKAATGDQEAAAVAASIEAGEIAFPSTMVDRITPATEDAHRALLAAEHHISDAFPVVCEPFKQWVVEDHFPSGRPAWEEAGAIMVKGEGGVHVYEMMKLRLLNGTHSALAYVSYLSGHRFVADAMADPLVLGFVSSFLDEVLPTVPEVAGIDLPQYRASLIERFSNPNIKDTLLRLAEDGSQKLQTTMRPVLLDQIAAGKSFDTMALAIGGWIRFMSGTDEEGALIEGIKDPQGGAQLTKLAKEVVADPSVATVGPFLLEYFGPEVAASEVALSSIADAVTALNEKGAKGVLARYV